MNAPLTSSRFQAVEDIPHGSPEMTRECLADLLWQISTRATIALNSLDLGDDFGLTRSMKCLAAEVDTALGLLVQIKAEAIRERERQQARNPEKVSA
ncbi:hypothetical protein J2X36_004613 [Methylobacterium sp. BE186]|uniref:hypothetical protein n=1 Tax=Methylobacterium sp. BE186 TaxID=2817715 RepID=UPI0028603117|nr:hypothetical protein [Methylobacterium sp. BE186]MDR7039835.1 hypothetical protein [Methylobacterium sp. BE186]